MKLCGYASRVMVVLLLTLVWAASVAQAKVQLTMVTHWNTTVTQGALMTKYVEEYNRIQDKVEVIFRNDPGANTTDKVLLWATTGTMPDILPVSQVNIPIFVQAGIISPMSEDLVKKMKSIFLPGALQLVSTDGQVWGYPTENMPNAFTYDLNDFNNKGIGNVFPQTWPDLMAVAKRLTTYDSKGAITRAGFGWNLDFRRNLGMLFALTWAEGGNVFTNNDRTLNLLSEPVKKSIDFLVEMIHGQSIMKFGGTHSHSVQAIRWAPGPYVQSSIIAESGIDRLAEINSARIPIGKNGKRMVANYGWVVAVPTATKHVKEVHDFLLWMTTELTDKRTTRMGDVMALLGSIPNTKPDILNQPMTKERFMQGFVGPMYDDEVRSWPMPPNSPAVLAALNTAMNDIINGKGAPMSVLENAQQKTQQLINDGLVK